MRNHCSDLFGNGLTVPALEHSERDLSSPRRDRQDPRWSYNLPAHEVLLSMTSFTAWPGNAGVAEEQFCREFAE